MHLDQKNKGLLCFNAFLMNHMRILFNPSNYFQGKL